MIIVGENTTSTGITVGYEEEMHISSGGVASDTTVNDGGSMFISSGGVANDTIVNSGGSIEIANGGEANSTVVNSGGSMCISSGGVANKTTVNSGGVVWVSSGGTATNVIWTPCVGSVYVADGAYVTYTSQYSGVYFGSNNQLLSSASTMDNKVVSGSMYVMSDGIANSTTVKSYGSMFISSGGVANDTTVNSRGSMSISSGGVANSTTVNSGGSMYISSGGTALEIIENGGYVNVADGAEVTFISNTFSGLQLTARGATVHSGTTAVDTILNSGGWMDISSGGVANSTTVNEWGDLYISSGGVANNTTVSYGGMSISSGGVANNTTVSGGWMDISSGGVANSTTVNEWGDLYISSGGVANNTIMSLGEMYIFSGGVANSTTINDYGSMFISSGGLANDTTVNPGGYMFISSGGLANDTTVKSGGWMYVSSGGVANSTTLNPRGYMEIGRGGVANDTTVNTGGWMDIVSGGVANSTTVNSGGTMKIFTGGTALEIIENGGYVYVAYGAEVTFASHTFSGLQLTARGATVHSGTTAVDTTLNSDGSMYISSGGVANDTTVNSRGSMSISSGGVANDTTLKSGGRMYIYSGGVANSTTLNGGSSYNNSAALYISSGGVANSTTVNSGGRMWIGSGGTATDIIWTPCEGHVSVEDGAYVTYVSQYSGVYFGSDNQLLSSAMTMDNTVVNETMYIMSGGVANSTMVNEWGSMFISSGGVANSTTVNELGSMYISSVGVANSTTLNSRGHMDICSGGVANNTTVSGGWMYIFSGGVANNTMLSGGLMEIFSGGVANDTTVNSGGSMRISSGGVANNTIMSLGEMYIFSGGIHRGHLKIENGAIVSAYQGAIIDFTVAEQESADTALINDISRITDYGAVYTLTVAEDQAFGNYILAGNAAAFDKTITVKTDEAELGKLAVGENITVDGVVYSLHLVDSNLTLTLDGPPELDVTVSQKESLDYEFVVKISEPASLQYKIDNGEWQDADGTTIAIAQNGTYSFRAEDLTGNMSEVVTKEISRLVFGNPEKTETTGGKTSWTPVKDESGNVQQVVVQYSVDNFETVVTIVTSESALKLWSLPDNVQWRVKGKNDPEWEVGEEISAEKNVSAPQKIESVADGVTDIFFARTAGRWTILHQARHQGIKGGWTGTQETASLVGKSKIVDVFSGAADVDILYLTDQGNGDALFVDDIYADSFEGIAKTQARIANLDEIRAGAGDDVVDMTSQRFDYVGDGVTIYGGDGDDVIWSNKGDNKLFGDAGNDHIVGASGNDVIVGGAGDDTLHGGGGDDIFCFGDDWGIDTVEQLSGGTVTLWFEDGSEENWNADTRTYSDGENTVTVSGTADVTLKFGGDISSLPEGIFSNAVTKKIFESTLA